MAAKGPLAGVRVLDLTNVLAGPFCTYQLGLLGADVIKVEQPGSGDLARRLGADPELNRRLMGVSFLALNAGKSSLTLNLKHERGREVFRRLAGTADVLVENFRPGVMDRLGLGYEQLRRSNPRLIYCAITGFGYGGPLSARPAYDQIIQGFSGVMSITGDRRSAPLRVGFPMCDALGGLTAAFAVVGALAGRQKTGEGAFLDVSMLDATLAAMGWVASNYLIAGHVPEPMGNDNFAGSPSGTFQAADGPFNIAANKDEHFVRLCEALGRRELLQDPRFADREDRKAHREELKAELEKTLRLRPAAEWEAILTAAGVPCGPILSVPAILAHPQVQERGLLQEFAEVPGVPQAVELLTAGFRIDGQALRAAGPPPGLGAHTDEILRELGFDRQAIDELRREGVV